MLTLIIAMREHHPQLNDNKWIYYLDEEYWDRFAKLGWIWKVIAQNGRVLHLNRQLPRSNPSLASLTAARSRRASKHTELINGPISLPWTIIGYASVLVTRQHAEIYYHTPLPRSESLWGGLPRTISRVALFTCNESTGVLARLGWDYLYLYHPHAETVHFDLDGRHGPHQSSHTKCIQSTTPHWICGTDRVNPWYHRAVRK